jgi:hypothetical protein
MVLLRQCCIAIVVLLYAVQSMACVVCTAMHGGNVFNLPTVRQHCFVVSKGLLFLWVFSCLLVMRTQGVYCIGLLGNVACASCCWVIFVAGLTGQPVPCISASVILA